MYFSPKLKWLEPYFKELKPLYKEFKKVKKVTVMRSSHAKRDRSNAELRPVEGGYNIVLRDHFQYIDFYPLSITIKPLNKVDVLLYFAHELAHLYYFNHPPERSILECQIMIYFMAKLKREGYVSEEYEESGGKYE